MWKLHNSFLFWGSPRYFFLLLLICPPFLKHSFAVYIILGWQSFSFSTLNLLSGFHAFCWEKAVILIENPLSGTSCFTFSAFWGGCFLCLCHHSLKMMCLGVLFNFMLFGIHWAFWICRLMVVCVFFSKFGKFSIIISSNIPFDLSFSGTPIVYMLVHLMVSHKSFRFIFLRFSFFFCSLHRIILMNLS